MIGWLIGIPLLGLAIVGMFCACGMVIGDQKITAQAMRWAGASIGLLLIVLVLAFTGVMAPLDEHGRPASQGASP
jgi:hypothetical protein